MANNCSLQHWTTNSRIDHVVSDNVTGPYTWHDVAVNTWAHNPAALDLGNGKFALVHIGNGAGSPNGGLCQTRIIKKCGQVSF